ncbi:hypothetical protein ACFE04_023253 [Oxalis oulophora]
MEAFTVGPPPISQPPHLFKPNPNTIKQRLLKKGVNPTPKIMHNLTKKETQKHKRKLNKQNSPPPPSQALEEEAHFLTLKQEYKQFNKAISSSSSSSSNSSNGSLVGKPWEKIERVKLKELALDDNIEGKGFICDNKFKRENLNALRDNFKKDLKWVLEDDIEIENGIDFSEEGKTEKPEKRQRPEGEAVRYLVERLSRIEVTVKDWKVGRMMKQSELQFTERQLLKIVHMLGDKRCWRQALAVVDYAYGTKEHKHFKSRFVYTKLMSILGKARRPQEALGIFNMMLRDYHLYPDMPVYHSIAVTLGQAGLLQELIKIIDCMRQKPSPERVKNIYHKTWNPVLQPDLVIYNSVLNACVSSSQWKGVSWVFEQLKDNGLTPNGATYGLAMEVMLKSGKFDLVHELFEQMKRKGEAPKALTYRVLVKTFAEEGKTNEAVEAVRDMEQKGVIGAASVYYELACCLCKNGRWQDAIAEVEKIKKLPRAKSLAVTFTGMIRSSADSGHIDDCISIFQKMKNHCSPNIGAINTMLKIYGRQDLFSKAKDLFEEIKRTISSSLNDDTTYLMPDGFTYSIMLEASASALQWEYFEYVYKEMIGSGFQIDQSKHASLLVNAARAGKGHLLENAFHEILEAGEIPNQMLYTEMVIEAAIQNNYERASALVNSMAHAPFRVSEKQWALLFEKSGDRIDRETLEQLLNTLGNCDVKSEHTISNLSKTLHSLCQCDLSSDGKEDNAVVHKVSESSKMFIPALLDDDNDEDEYEGAYFADLAYGGLIPGLDGDNDDEDELEAFIGDRREPNLPSADEILQAWKESRHKDGIYLPFQRPKSESK